MPETLGEAVLEVSLDDRRLKAGLRDVGTTVDSVGKSIRGALLIGGGLIAGAGAAGAFRSVIDAAVELDAITRRLANTLGEQGAQQALGQSRQLADELGISYTNLANSFARFTAAATPAGVALEQQNALFAATVTQAQRLGLSNEELSGSFLAFQQIAAKGVVQSEELRGQLAERLPTALAATAQGLGITVGELQALVETGQLTSTQFFDAITSGFEELNGNGTGSAKTAGQTFEAFNNVLKELQQTVGAEFLPGLTSGISQATRALQGFLVLQQGREISGLGFSPDESVQLAGDLKRIENQLGLTREQSQNLLTDVIAEIGQARGGADQLFDSFGRLNLSSEEFAFVLTDVVDRAKAFTAESRRTREENEQSARAATAALRADRDRLDTAEKVTERLKERREELQGLRFDSEAYNRVAEEIRELELLDPAEAAKSAQTLEDASRKAAEESQKVADNYEKAAQSLQSAEESFANTIAASDLASRSAQSQARETLTADVLRNLQSGAIDQQAVTRQFGLNVAGPGSLDISGGGQSFSQQFSGQIGALDLSALSLDQLSELSRETSTLADASAEVSNSNRELVTATQELAGQVRESNQRESNLNITVAPGQSTAVFLP